MFSFKGRLPLVAHRSRFAHKGFVRRQFYQTSGNFSADTSHPEAVQGSDHANDYLSTSHGSTLHNAEQAIFPTSLVHPVPLVRLASLVRPVSPALPVSFIRPVSFTLPLSLVGPVSFVRSVSFLRPAPTRPTSALRLPTPTMYLVRRGCHDLFGAKPHSPDSSSTAAVNGPGEGKVGAGHGFRDAAEKPEDDLKTVGYFPFRPFIVLEKLHEHSTVKGLARVEAEIKSTKNQGRGFFFSLLGTILLGVGLKIVWYDVSMEQKYDNNLLRVQDTIKADMKTMQQGLEKGHTHLEGELKSIAAKLEKLVGRGWF
ncbi:hypothetical protein B9Z19DRAFT_1061068 [Tuber borchii]|uniref:Uncharacterized protein n=1 Tax=Tuber borchii TaxID=42251 RepID=A0A2T7A6N6_TUBBO|nr:hypothetical protein B9Z19DRAFT_1061068 [Tuber borchii]